MSKLIFEYHLGGGRKRSRYPQDTLMLSSQCNQVLHGWIGATLGNCSQKLASLGKPNSIVAILQFWIVSNLLASHLHLFVDWFKESIDGIINDSVTDLE